MAFGQTFPQALFVMLCLVVGGHALTLEKSEERMMFMGPAVMGAKRIVQSQGGTCNRQCRQFEDKVDTAVRGFLHKARVGVDAWYEDMGTRAANGELGRPQDDIERLQRDALGLSNDLRFEKDMLDGLNKHVTAPAWQTTKELANTNAGKGFIMASNAGLFSAAPGGPAVRLCTLGLSAAMAAEKEVSRDGAFDTVDDAAATIARGVANAAAFSPNPCTSVAALAALSVDNIYQAAKLDVKPGDKAAETKRQRLAILGAVRGTTAAYMKARGVALGDVHASELSTIEQKVETILMNIDGVGFAEAFIEEVLTGGTDI